MKSLAPAGIVTRQLSAEDLTQTHRMKHYRNPDKSQKLHFSRILERYPHVFVAHYRTEKRKKHKKASTPSQGLRP